jgi:hypothetical protein
VARCALRPVQWYVYVCISRIHSLAYHAVLTVGQRGVACLISSLRFQSDLWSRVCVWLLSATAGSTLGPSSVAVWRRVRVLMWRRIQIGLAVFGGGGPGMGIMKSL